MFQDTSEYIYVQNDTTSTGMITHGGIHSTPNSQTAESEASFDSGYLSPATSQKAPGGFIPLTNDHVFNGTGTFTYQPTPPNQKVAFDDEWDKKFIENFEANLFGIDPMEDFSSEDINLFSELLSSPLKGGVSPAGLFHGHSPAKYSRSPLRNLFSPPRSLHSKVSLFTGTNWNTNNDAVTFSRPADPVPVTITHNAVYDGLDQHRFVDQRLSTHDYAKPHTISYSGQSIQQNANYTRSVNPLSESMMAPNSSEVLPTIAGNMVPELLPPKQKLQYVRAKFKQTLQKAVENADNAALNEEKYPQLTKRLSKLSSAGQVSSRKESVSSCMDSLPDEEKSSSLSALDIAETQFNSAPKRFRELAPAPSGKRTFACIVNNQYEVKQKSDCRVVIKKRRTY
ncbi:uncharacterized protein LOC126827205 [Patella vulgata]|uniref:uncharacterized protein LOC126827205 n=1 Tax=Patella vulgata TaxID=6465 RepID=UPI00217F3765|nr:uncharacterized protein LOC126827205 [Patella vulgata]XP_050412400.1 uncharacterized protein LOC126827205 [Patella vulgata]